jgi:hypothetical protein
MPLPEWTDDGLLPPGTHPAELPDVYDRFVVDTPPVSREQRELIFAALSLHLRLIRRIIPGGRAWIDGSFATRGELSPKDVDVAICPTDRPRLESLPVEDRAQLYGLLTMQDVSVVHPVIWLPRLQAVSGLVDAFIVRADQEATWDQRWSAVLGPDSEVLPDQKKGYAEVRW